MKRNAFQNILLAGFFVDIFIEALAMNNSSIVNTSSHHMTPTLTSSSFSQSLTQSMLSMNQSSSAIGPSPQSTSTNPPSSVTDTAQINVGGSSENSGSSYIPLPPENQRHDFELVANTNMKWIIHLLDRNSLEFLYMKKRIEETFNELFGSLPGFIKTKLSEFQKDKVTFIVIIYTRKADKVTKEMLEKAVGSYLNTGDNVYKIYLHEVKPRFQEMPPDLNTKPVYGGTAAPKENVNHFVNFMQGFGIAIGMVVVFIMLAYLKLKISQACKSKDNEGSEICLKEGFDNEGIEKRETP